MTEPLHDSSKDAPTDAPRADRPPEPRPGRGFWLLMFFSLAAVGGFAYLQYVRVDRIRRGGAYATPIADLPVLGRVPDFALLERGGRRVSLGDLKGRVWVADFIFTSCGGPCPIMTRRMRALHRTLKQERLSGVCTVSISVDPIRDTPEQLREYATIHGADDDDWLFLTGGEQEVRDLSVRGFKLPVQPEAGTDPITHSTRFVLVDREGRIRGYYEVVTEAELDLPRARVMDRPMPAETRRKLLADIRALLAEGPSS